MKGFQKKQLTLLKVCVASLLCGPRADLWPFYGVLCKRFSLYIKVYTVLRENRLHKKNVKLKRWKYKLFNSFSLLH